MKKCKLLGNLICVISFFHIDAGSFPATEDVIEPLDEATYKKLLNDIEKADGNTIDGLNLISKWIGSRYCDESAGLQDALKSALNISVAKTNDLNGKYVFFHQKEAIEVLQLQEGIAQNLKARDKLLQYVEIEKKANEKLTLVLNDYESLINDFNDFLSKNRLEDISFYSVTTFKKICDDAKKILEKLDCFLKVDSVVFKNNRDVCLKTEAAYKSIYDFAYKKYMNGIYYCVCGAITAVCLPITLYRYVNKKKDDENKQNW